MRQGIGLGAQAHALQHRERARPVGLLAAQARAEGDVAKRAEPRHEQVLLRHVSDRRAAQDVQAARFQPLQARDDPKQAGLAHAARPQQAGPAAPLQDKLQAVEEQRALEAKSRAFDADGVVRFGVWVFWWGHVSFPTPVLTGSGSRGRRSGSDLSAAYGSPRAMSIVAEGPMRCKRAGPLLHIPQSPVARMWLPRAYPRDARFALPLFNARRVRAARAWRSGPSHVLHLDGRRLPAPRRRRFWG